MWGVGDREVLRGWFGFGVNVNEEVKELGEWKDLFEYLTENYDFKDLIAIFGYYRRIWVIFNDAWVLLSLNFYLWCFDIF